MTYEDSDYHTSSKEDGNQYLIKNGIDHLQFLLLGQAIGSKSEGKELTLTQCPSFQFNTR